ncbi:hypothetical protein CAP36_11995 [Chitinophagaceae bacterium IBVUCB2]|nr:hypothetical protein CAP36_11995 [Chitinophagaceae bacterium IBVUCB2]
MTIKLIQQYIYERDTWCRLLDYLEEENILYKNRIANILKSDSDSLLIEMIESFLNKFVMEDAIISILRHDIAKANIKIVAKGKDFGKDGNSTDIIITQDKLRGEIEIIEQQFNRLKFEFNKYLSKAS